MRPPRTQRYCEECFRAGLFWREALGSSLVAPRDSSSDLKSLAAKPLNREDDSCFTGDTGIGRDRHRALDSVGLNLQNLLLQTKVRAQTLVKGSEEAVAPLQVNSTDAISSNSSFLDVPSSMSAILRMPFAIESGRSKATHRAHKCPLACGFAYGNGVFLKGDQVKGKNDLQADTAQVGAARNPRSDERYKGNRNQKGQSRVRKGIDKDDTG